MTAIDKANDLLVKTMSKFGPITFEQAKTISLLIASEMIDEYEIVRIEAEMRSFYLKYWKNVKQHIEKL
jgi:hypothetical protein